MIYGYARCSTNDDRQDIDRQIRELKKKGATDKTIYFEYVSGAKARRPEYEKLLNIISDGDTLCCTEVSRLTRSTAQLCEIISIAQEKQLCLKLGEFTLDCRNGNTDPATKAMLMMWGVFAEMERNIISERVKSGMANAKAKGAVFGRPTLTVTNLPPQFLKYYPLYVEKKITATDLAKLSGLTRRTVYNYFKIIKESDNIKIK